MYRNKSQLFCSRKRYRNIFFLFLLTALAGLYLAGCASSGKDSNEAFVEKWLEKAEKSQPRSQEIKERKTVEIDEVTPDAAKEAARAPQKPLPDQKVTLHLRDAPVPAVLRAMARAAGQNILVNETVSGTMSVNIENVPWNHAFKSILESQGLIYNWQDDIIRIKSMQDLKREIEMSGLQQEVNQQKIAARKTGPLVSSIIKINYADAEKLSQVLARFLSKGPEGETRGEIAVDKETNSLIVQAGRDDLTRMKKLITHLDKPRSQILIEANIVEATQETAKELGMRWSGRYVTSSGSFDDFGIAGEPRQPVESFIGPDGLSMEIVAGRIAGNVLYAHLQALQKDGKLHILSSPSITTMDNQMAYTEHGEKVPFETTDDEGNPEVEFEDAVLRLEVVPHIIDEKHMKMEIKVKKDQVDFTQTVDGNPLIRTKETETNLVVQHGETIVISGLSKQTVSETDQGLPGLKNIPGLGWLFKGLETNKEMEEFMIFLTPTILGTKTQ
ncbi:MAG: type IV pilus secretin PilQ [Desulfobacteraceae bacterium]|nr:type IV pilus secretin PilQ [Desulfobacteraceae bacterium]